MIFIMITTPTNVYIIVFQFITLTPKNILNSGVYKSAKENPKTKNKQLLLKKCINKTFIIQHQNKIINKENLTDQD